MNHIYPIIKPVGPTSHDIIYKLRKITGIKKIGHAGTLDPAASGVLVVGITREGTKQLGMLEKTEKEYIAEIKLGETSNTDDREGEITKATSNKKQLTSKMIKPVISSLIGEIEQVPPIYSAIKIKGKPAHRRVRAGENIKLKSRKVLIRNIEIMDFSWPILKIKVTCGPGTYIRSLARDIGNELGVGGYLASLKRTRVGEYRIENAYSLEDFNIYWKNNKEE